MDMVSPATRLSSQSHPGVVVLFMDREQEPKYAFRRLCRDDFMLRLRALGAVALSFMLPGTPLPRAPLWPSTRHWKARIARNRT